MESEEIVKLMSTESQRKKTPILSLIVSFVTRDFKIWWTYKFWLTLDISGTILLVASYYLFSLVTSSQQVQDAGYTVGGYFAFALIGIAFQQYVFFAIQGINESIREEQWNGTIETLLSSSTDFKVFLLGETVFYFIVSSVFLFVSLIIGVLLGAIFSISLASIISATTLSFLLIASHMVVGVLSAGVLMKTKQGNPLTWVFSWMTQLVSGVFYPLNLLPSYLEWVGKLFPLTYSLEGIRLCLQSNQNLTSPLVLNDAISLVLFTVLATPIALFVFRKGYNSARKDGSLGQY